LFGINYTLSGQRCLVYKDLAKTLRQAVSKKKQGIYQAIIEKHTSFYYRIINDAVEILIFVDNRMNPSKKDKQLKSIE
jgi:hypothetical protein